MTIILARLSGDRVVHMFPAEQNISTHTRTAFCGITGDAAALLPVSRLTGMGCELCVRESPGESPTDVEEVWPPSDSPDSDGTYAVGLRGERQWHHIPQKPLISSYEGRTVVLTECGVIGFVVQGHPSWEWHECDACVNYQGRSEDA